MINKIKEKIEQGIPCKVIAEQLKVHPNTVGNYAKKLGLNKKRLSITEKNEIIKRIQNGDFYTDIAKEYKVSQQAIKQIADNNNISNNKRFKRKHSFNENYFEKINDERKAYWLGFLLADGCVSYSTEYYKVNNKPNRLQINISNKDIKLLETFCDDIGYDKSKICVYKPQGTYSTNLMCKISINSVKICSELNPQKLLSYIHNEYTNHYIRGFLDGDGTIYKSKGRAHIRFCGSYEFLHGLKKYMKENKIIQNDNKIIIDTNKNISYYCFANKKDIESFKKNIYKNATIYLDRKYNNL